MRQRGGGSHKSDFCQIFNDNWGRGVQQKVTNDDKTGGGGGHYNWGNNDQNCGALQQFIKTDPEEVC